MTTDWRHRIHSSDHTLVEVEVENTNDDRLVNRLNVVILLLMHKKLIRYPPRLSCYQVHGEARFLPLYVYSKKCRKYQCALA